MQQNVFHVSKEQRFDGGECCGRMAKIAGMVGKRIELDASVCVCVGHQNALN